MTFRDVKPGDERAGELSIQQQMLQFEPQLRAYAMSLSRSADRSDDLVQETLLRAISKIHTFRPGTNLGAWLTTILRNCYLSDLRRRRHEVEDADGCYSEALRAALQTSGLFYESHLTDMVFGRSNPAQLQQEPQAKLTRSGVPSEADLARPRADSASTSASRSGGDAPTTAGGTNTPAPGTPVSGIHQDLTVLVRQQLDVLANQALTWQGEAWPGTPMEWEVEREPYGGDPESGVPTWATRLKLDLPRLGLVDARLNLAGDQIVLQLVAPHGAAELNESSDQLRSRLLAAGLTLSHLVVNVVDPRPVMPTDF